MNSSDHYRKLADEILIMAASDQAMRARALTYDYFWDESVDKLNTLRMRKIVEDIGWPTIGKVGQDASNGAWLLVQHADKDVTFQEQCLVLIKSLLPGEVALHAIPYLEDRIRVNKKLPQVYGTQFRDFVPCPIENFDEVDKRRQEVGLTSLAEGVEAHRKKYSLAK